MSMRGGYVRGLGYSGEIFVLNQPFSDEIEEISKHKLTVGISCMSFIEELAKRPSDFTVHLEIGTGM